MPFQAHNYLLLSWIEQQFETNSLEWTIDALGMYIHIGANRQAIEQSSKRSGWRFHHQDADDGVAMMGMSNGYSWTNWWSNSNAIYWKTVLIRFYNNSYRKYNAICDADDYICQFVYLKKRALLKGFMFLKCVFIFLKEFLIRHRRTQSM